MGQNKASKSAKLRWAKFRHEKGKATKEDLELLGIQETNEIKTEVKDEIKTPIGEVANSRNYKDVSIDAFISDAKEHTRSDFTASDFFSLDNSFDSDKNISLNENNAIDTALIKGSTILFFIDLIFPNILVFIYNKITKKSLDVSDLKMDEHEKEELEEVANKVAEKLGFEFDNPTYELLIGLAIVYGSKLYLAIQITKGEEQ